MDWDPTIVIESERGCPRLFHACMYGHIERVKTLLKNDNDSIINGRNYYRKTPLKVATEYGHMNVAEFLIKNGGKL